MKKYVTDGTVQAFELWNPANLGYLAAYAAVNLASEEDHQRARARPSPRASSASTRSARTTPSCSARRSCSTKANINQLQLPLASQPSRSAAADPADEPRRPTQGDRCARLLPGPGPAGPADEYRARHGQCGRRCRRAAGGGLGQLLAVPGRRRPAHRLPGDRRLRGGAASGWPQTDVNARWQAEMAAVLRRPRRPARPTRGSAGSTRSSTWTDQTRPDRDCATDRCLEMTRDA